MLFFLTSIRVDIQKKVVHVSFILNIVQTSFTHANQNCLNKDI